MSAEDDRTLIADARAWTHGVLTAPGADRFIRRLCNALEARLSSVEATTPSDELVSLRDYALSLIQAERARHESLGWTREHDEGHCEQLVDAASTYEYWRKGLPLRENSNIPRRWPWDAKYFKPRTEKEDLVRAGALYLAALSVWREGTVRLRPSVEPTLEHLIEVLTDEPLIAGVERGA